MFLSAFPGLGSVSGVVHLAARRPLIVAIAVVALATLAFTNMITLSIPALSSPPVPAAPIVQHTPRPSITLHEHVAWHASNHRQKRAAKQRLAVKQQPVV
jgi:hypothetical protein